MTLTAAFLVAVLSMGSHHDRIVLEESVDVVEVNHMFDDDGKPVLDQLLFYRWNRDRHELIDWRSVKSPECLPACRGGRWECVWVDGIQLRRIRVGSVRESWTQWDPELIDRDVLPTDRRQKLRPK
jgi:hypothetical protein